VSSYDFHSFRVKGIHFYHCDELQEFVYSCIERFESLPMKQLAETLNEFVERYVCCDCIVYMYLYGKIFMATVQGHSSKYCIVRKFGEVFNLAI